MRVADKKRILYLLNLLKWSFSTAKFLAICLHAERRSRNPSVGQIIQFMRILNNYGFVNVRVGRKEIWSYQLKREWTIAEIERELLL